MSKASQYATKQQFGGQRVSLKRAVLVVLHDPNQLLSGEVVEIDTVLDAPILQVGDGSSFRGMLKFFECRTIEDLERMPTSSWTWPPRV